MIEQSETDQFSLSEIDMKKAPWQVAAPEIELFSTAYDIDY